MNNTGLNEKTPSIKGITCDSRKVKPGYAFVAIRGFKEDGNNYILNAIDRGASVVFTDKNITENIPNKDIPIIKVKDARSYLGYLAASYYEHPSKKLKLIGTTGTNGKTTTTHLIYHLLNYYSKNNKNTPKKISGLIGTVNVDTGKEIIPGNLTTPPPVKLQQYLYQMIKSGLKYACMEVSSHGIKLKRISGTKFAVKVATNISIDHYDLHPDFEEYINVKKQFLENSGKTIVLINNDNKYLNSFGIITKNQLNFSIKKYSDIQAKKIQNKQSGNQFIYQLNRHIKREDGSLLAPCKIPIKTNLPGKHNIYNSLIAITIALYYEIPCRTIRYFFHSFNGVWRRFQFIYKKDYTIIDDCAHNPGSYRAVFAAVKKMKYNRLIIVNSLRGNRGVKINKKNAETISKKLLELNKYILYTTNCSEVVKPIDKIKAEEEEIFLQTLKKNNIQFEHYQQLNPALKQALSEVGKNDIILLLGPHSMDHAGEMILEMNKISVKT
ncbi:MAG: Mur ligase family protein [Halanaerobiaceae bacterium]